MKKKEETKKRLFDAAIDLFRNKGYQATTMREIAKEANTALGSAYYYYSAKEEIVLDYYLGTQTQVYELSHKIISNKSLSFSKKLIEIFFIQFEILAESKSFLGALAKEAIDPDSDLSPFSVKSREVREIHLQLFQSLLIQFADFNAKELELLAYQLWLLQMALLFFWLNDSSDQSAQTRKITEQMVSLINRALKFYRLPMLRAFFRQFLEVLKTIQEIMIK